MSENLSQIVLSQRDQFLAVRSDNSIEFAREAEFAIQLFEGNDYLAKIALQNPQSARNAIVNVGAIGITLNPAQKLAYLVPRDNKVCLDISYMGLMHIAMQSGAIQWGQAVIVRKNDTFEIVSLDQQPIHKYQPFATTEERGPITGVYVTVKTDSGDYLTHPMPIAKVFEIRDRSSAWKSYKAKGTKCPWVTDEEEMIKKTCVKQASKYWPRRDRLDAAIHNLNTDAGEGLAMDERAGYEQGMDENAVADFMAAIEAAVTKDELTEIWDKAKHAALAAKDAAAYERMKAAMLKSAEAIKRTMDGEQ